MLSINEIARRVLYTPPAMTLGTFSHTLDLTKGHAVRAEKEMVERKARRKECSRERHSVSQKLCTSNKAAGSLMPCTMEQIDGKLGPHALHSGVG